MATLSTVEEPYLLGRYHGQRKKNDSQVNRESDGFRPNSVYFWAVCKICETADFEIYGVDIGNSTGTQAG